MGWAGVHGAGVVDGGDPPRHPAPVLAEPTDFCRLYLFRHPELSAAHRNLAVGRGPADLSRRGRAQVLGWLEILDGVTLDGVSTATQSQCREPAAALAAKHSLELNADNRLDDQDLGAWQGRPWDDVVRGEPDRVRDFFGNFGEVVPPEGEALGQAVERLLGWWQEQAPQAAGKTLAVVLAGGLICGWLAALLGMRLSQGVSFNLDPGSLGVVDVHGNAARIASWNPTAFD